MYVCVYMAVHVIWLVISMFQTARLLRLLTPQAITAPFKVNFPVVFLFMCKHCICSIYGAYGNALFSNFFQNLHVGSVLPACLPNSESIALAVLKLLAFNARPAAVCAQCSRSNIYYMYHSTASGPANAGPEAVK